MIEGYAILGRFEEAIQEGRATFELDKSKEPQYENLLNAYISQGRFGEAKELAKLARAQGQGGARLHWRYLEMAFPEDAWAAAKTEIEWFAGKPEEYLSLSLQAREADALGQRRKARDLYRRASETALRQNLSTVAADATAADALADALVGDCRSVRKLGVRRWRQGYVAMQYRLRGSSPISPSYFRMERSGTRCNCRKFKRQSS